MAYRITPACTACGLCLPECPVSAIAAADPIFVINTDHCCDSGDCLAACPEAAIVPADSAGWQAFNLPEAPSLPASHL